MRIWIAALFLLSACAEEIEPVAYEEDVALEGAGGGGVVEEDSQASGPEVGSGGQAGGAGMAGGGGVAGGGGTGCIDADGDGWQERSCNPNPAHRGGDCADRDPAIHPGRDENCGNEIDNDCNGQLPSRDPACVACDDLDQDGWEAQNCNANRNAQGGDCNDQNPSVNPGAEEICGNFRDDDCQGGDVPCMPNCTDADQDGFGVGSGCRGDDCDDSNAQINRWASEICGDGVDQDCNGQDLSCPQHCQDRDHDGFGTGDDCIGADCDDQNPNINPAAWDIPGDGIDQDCSGRDGAIAQECVDRDQDGHGEGRGCLAEDCDDSDPRIHQNRDEICGNNIDDDCVGGDRPCIHQGTGECVDLDGDGFGSGACPNGGPDCDDQNPEVNPDAREVCNGVDDNCNETIDECPRRGQICDGQVCVGGPGTSCREDNDCAVSAHLHCDEVAGECRIQSGEPCAEDRQCPTGAECSLVANCPGQERRCHQSQGGACGEDCDCSGDLFCHSEEESCVECREDMHCQADRSSCTTGGFCAARTLIGGADMDVQVQLLGLMAECWRRFSEERSVIACNILEIDEVLMTGGVEVETIEGTDDDHQEYVCEQDLEALGVDPADIGILEELFGCGLFDILNLWWWLPLEAGTDTLCLLYVPNMHGFDWPDVDRPAVVVERCDRASYR